MDFTRMYDFNILANRISGYVQVKDYLADPSKFAAVAAPAVGGAATAAPAAKVEPKKEEPSEEEDMGFSLFD